MTDNKGTTLQGYLPFPEGGGFILEHLDVLIEYVRCKIHTTVISHIWNLVLNPAMTWAGGPTCGGLSQGLGELRSLETGQQGGTQGHCHEEPSSGCLLRWGGSFLGIDSEAVLGNPL